MGCSGYEDRILLGRLKQGSETAFKKIYDKYHRSLYRVAKKYLRNKELAEDAVHDIFLKLWHHRAKMNQSGSLKGFLFTSLKNHVLNLIDRDKRKLKKRVTLSYEKKMDGLENSNVIDLAQYRGLYQEAVEELPDKRREVYRLRVKEGLTNNEVAEYLDVSIHTVKSQYYKASNFVKKYVSEHLSKPTGT
ncbi:RNA polymerase sigma factor [Fodinibius salsisoli]|uniref:RNA polymerase sigma-70 factor n=1 Tax=Fodinibius salsisoli TaxID=2820877 RepID=A0ABT3PNZ7_9BACT|nr:RNA polymerase sigma-70 factor [Fodinibius salsisoli]MCW9707585.1 RNA polymerase sigma-70 factor [Fodinibius salsisoli]